MNPNGEIPNLRTFGRRHHSVDSVVAGSTSLEFIERKTLDKKSRSDPLPRKREHSLDKKELKRMKKRRKERSKEEESPDGTPIILTPPTLPSKSKLITTETSLLKDDNHSTKSTKSTMTSISANSTSHSPLPPYGSSEYSKLLQEALSIAQSLQSQREMCLQDHEDATDWMEDPEVDFMDTPSTQDSLPCIVDSQSQDMKGERPMDGTLVEESPKREMNKVGDDTSNLEHEDSDSENCHGSQAVVNKDKDKDKNKGKGVRKKESESSDAFDSYDTSDEDEVFSQNVGELRTIVSQGMLSRRPLSMTPKESYGEGSLLKIDHENGFVVVSCFDGIGAALQSLRRVGLKVRLYISIDIDNEAQTVVRSHFQNKVNLSCHKDIRYFNYNVFLSEMQRYNVDPKSTTLLIIGGSPCDDLSIANPKRKGLKGQNSKLFYEFKRIVDEFKMRHGKFLMIFENVASMESKDKEEITKRLGMEPMRLDAKNISGTRRDRFYWTNYEMVSVFPDSPRPAYEFLSQDAGKMNKLVNCLTTSNKCEVILKNQKTRKLKITERERLLGFPSGYTNVMGIPESHRQKLIGKSFSLFVICYLLQPLCENALVLKTLNPLAEEPIVLHPNKNTLTQQGHITVTRPHPS